MPRGSKSITTRQQSSWPQTFLSVAEHLCPHSNTRLPYGSEGRDCAPEQSLLQMALIPLHDSCVPTGWTRGDQAAKLEFGVRRSSGEDLTLC